MGFIKNINKKRVLENFKNQLQIFTGNILSEFNNIDRENFNRDLFILMSNDFLYITGSYDIKNLTEAPLGLMAIREYIRSISKESVETSVLTESIYYIADSINAMFCLKNELENDFQIYFDSYKSKFYLDENELINIEKILKIKNKLEKLEKLKNDSLASMLHGVMAFLAFFWGKENLHLYNQNLKNNADNLNICSQLSMLKDLIFISYMKKYNVNKLIFKKSTVGIDLHELLCFFICITRNVLRAKTNRTFVEQENNANINDILLFNISDFLKLQLNYQMKSVKHSNICNLYNFICYSYPLQCLVFFKLIYYLNYLNPLDCAFSDEGGLKYFNKNRKELEGIIFRFATTNGSSQEDRARKYKHYLKNLWHKSIVQRRLYFSYISYIKIHNKLKIVNSIYNHPCTSCKTLIGENIQFDKNLNSQSRFIDFIRHFLATNSIIFRQIESKNYQDKRNVYKIEQKMNSLGFNYTTKPNALTIRKESLQKEHQNEKLFFDIFTKLVEFYEILVIYTDKETNISKRKNYEKPVFNPMCQESFQMIRDINLLIFKSSFFVSEYILEKFFLVGNDVEFIERDNVTRPEINQALTYCRKIIKQMIENFSINDQNNQDCETFLQADLKEIFINYTLLVLEMLMLKTGFDFTVHSELKIMLYIMLKLVKILPSVNTYFNFYASEAHTYFQKICSAYSVCTVQYGNEVFKYAKTFE